MTIVGEYVGVLGAGLTAHSTLLWISVRWTRINYLISVRLPGAVQSVAVQSAGLWRIPSVKISNGPIGEPRPGNGGAAAMTAAWVPFSKVMLNRMAPFSSLRARLRLLSSGCLGCLLCRGSSCDSGEGVKFVFADSLVPLQLAIISFSQKASWSPPLLWLLMYFRTAAPSVLLLPVSPPHNPARTPSSKFLKAVDPAHPPELIIEQYEDPIRADVIPMDCETKWTGTCYVCICTDTLTASLAPWVCVLDNGSVTQCVN